MRWRHYDIAKAVDDRWWPLCTCLLRAEETKYYPLFELGVTHSQKNSSLAALLIAGLTDIRSVISSPWLPLRPRMGKSLFGVSLTYQQYRALLPHQVAKSDIGCNCFKKNLPRMIATISHSPRAETKDPKRNVEDPKVKLSVSIQ